MAKGPKDQAVSERLPVARVAVDISLAHLDRPFDYLVPARLDQRPCRAAGSGSGSPASWSTATCWNAPRPASTRAGWPGWSGCISPEPVLTPEIFDLARAVADRYAGTLADVLRLAIPPRHATAEREAPPRPAAPAGGPRPAAIRPPRRPGRTRLLEPATRRGGVPGRRWPRAARSGPPGRPCPVRSGRPRSPWPPPPRPPRAAAWSSSCRTPATWTAWTPP